VTNDFSSGTTAWSRQLKDCCGRFTAYAAVAMYSYSGTQLLSTQVMSSGY
jgi:hypothetical protein